MIFSIFVITEDFSSPDLHLPRELCLRYWCLIFPHESKGLKTVDLLSGDGLVSLEMKPLIMWKVSESTCPVR